MGRRSGILFGAALLVLTTVFVAISLTEVRSRLIHLVADEPMRLGLALVLMTSAVVWYSVSWSLVLGLIRSERLFNLKLIRFCLTTWPARYIPGTVPYHAARVLLASRLGVSKRAVGTSILYELVLGVSSATLIGFACVLFASGGSQVGDAYVLVVLPLAALPLLLQPGILLPVVNRMLLLLRREGFAREDVLDRRQTAVALISYCLVHLFNGLAFWVLITAVTDSPVGPVLALGVFSLASAAGVAVLFVPSGIGVREVVLVGLLSSQLSTTDALLVAGSARAVTVLADLTPLALIMLSGGVRRVLQFRRASEATLGASHTG
jgi:glycosyltransferase 2 family protein